jgi:hypothetical protein
MLVMKLLTLALIKRKNIAKEEVFCSEGGKNTESKLITIEIFIRWK